MSGEVEVIIPTIMEKQMQLSEVIRAISQKTIKIKEIFAKNGSSPNTETQIPIDLIINLLKTYSYKMVLKRLSQEFSSELKIKHLVWKTIAKKKEGEGFGEIALQENIPR